MVDEQSQEAMLEQQKANCIFCKIIKGEIPSKKVYEDDHMLAILDINPAVKGHILVMPKEHYPIMPLIPPEEFEHLFGTTAALSGVLKEGMLVPRVTVFIANGAIAGQQSPHFLFHILPREDGDGLNMLTVEGKGINQSDLQEVLEKNLYAVMRQHLQKMNKMHLLQIGDVVEEKNVEERKEEEKERVQPPSGQPSQERLSVIANLVQQSPEIQELIQKNPTQLKSIIAQNPELAKVFEGIDVTKLASILGTVQQQAPPGERSEEKEPSQEVQPHQDIIPARDMTMNQLFTYIDEKMKLKELMLHDPEELKRLIPENKRLSIFFEGSNIDAIIQAYQEYAKDEHGIRVTVEPEEEKELPPAPPPKGPSREEAEDAWEMQDQTHDDRLGRIGRLLR